MLKKIIAKIITLGIYKLPYTFRSFDFNKYTIPYTIAGKKSMSYFFDSQEHIENNILPMFDELVQKKIVLMETEYSTIETWRGLTSMMKVYFYYLDAYWRVKQLRRIQTNIHKYNNSIEIR